MSDITDKIEDLKKGFSSSPPNYDDMKSYFEKFKKFIKDDTNLQGHSAIIRTLEHLITLCKQKSKVGYHDILVLINNIDSIAEVYPKAESKFRELKKYLLDRANELKEYKL